MFRLNKSWYWGGFLSLTFLILLSKLSWGTDFHAIFVFDTFERPDRVETYNFLYYEFESMAQYAGLNYVPHSFIAEEFDYERIVNFLEQFRCAPDDTVLFVFDGHGANTAHSIWPRLWFRLSKQELTFEWITDQLRVKKPRLLIVLSGSCNSGKELVIPPPLRIANGGVSFPTQQDCYQGLLTNMRGEVLGTAAKPGEVSWSTDRNVYLTSFVKAVEKICQKHQQASWEEVMQTAYEQSVGESRFLGDGEEQGPQHPIDYVAVQPEANPANLDAQFAFLASSLRPVDDLEIAFRRLTQEHQCITWWFQNSISSPIHVQFYAQSTYTVWPGGGKVYVLPDDEKLYTLEICDRAGEKICYGAWTAGTQSKAWGVGPEQIWNSSQDACYRCENIETHVIQFVP